MRTRTTLAFALLVSSTAATFAACSIDTGGDSTATHDASVGMDVVSVDAVFADTNLPSSCGDANNCLPSVPDGWEITMMMASSSAACPSGFNSADLLKDIQLVGSCVCSCIPQGTPSCSIPHLLLASGAAACGLDGGNLPTDGTCTTVSSQRIEVPHSNLGGITCVPTRTGDAGISSSITRLCQPTCAADFCGSIASGATACIVGDGDQMCPAGYTQKTALAVSAGGGCNACTTCLATTAKCVGVVSSFTSDDCSGTPSSTGTDDGLCHADAGAIGSLTYVATVPEAGVCGASNDPKGIVSPLGPKTLCCP